MLSESSIKQRINFIDSDNCLKDQSFVRRKPGRPPKQHSPGTINGIIAECAVCHDRATGLHYAVMTCEGCKGFFKRSIQSEKIYKCRNKGDCVINKENRNACQACRMKSCFEMGMKENLVRDDRTPGNRKKKYTDTTLLTSFNSSNNTDNATSYASAAVTRTISEEHNCMEQTKDYPVNQYPICKKICENYNYYDEIPTFNMENIYIPSNCIKHELLNDDISPLDDFDCWEFSPMDSVTMVDDNTSDVIQHLDSVCDPRFNSSDISPVIYVNCSGENVLPSRKCEQHPRCLMHLLAKQIKAKPVEPAYCKYYERYPSSNQLLDCLAEEIHFIIKFAKKTPGFCELGMSHKLDIIRKRALSILFIRIIYRSLSCPLNHVQFAANLCLDYSDFDKIDILSQGIQQTIFELISSFKLLKLDIYEICLIQYAIIEDEDWDPDIHLYPEINEYAESRRNISQKYLKLYTTNKYADQPHRWIFIMLNLTQVQEIVKLFTTQCLEMITAQRLTISNDIFKEIFSI